MVKSIFAHSIISGILSGIAGVVYQYIYENMYFLDYSEVINAGSIVAASIIGCVLMGLGYYTLLKLNKLKWMSWVNIIYMLIAFISILPVMGMTLPLEVEFPELFPGLVIPMHFFVPMIFFGMIPIFKLHGVRNG